MQGAKNHLNQVWQILEAQKINQDLFVDMYLAAVHLTFLFRLMGIEEFLAKLDSVKRIIHLESSSQEETSIATLNKICTLITVK